MPNASSREKPVIHSNAGFTSIIRVVTSVIRIASEML